jgi:hypothetical protein
MFADSPYSTIAQSTRPAPRAVADDPRNSGRKMAITPTNPRAIPST